MIQTILIRLLTKIFGIKKTPWKIYIIILVSILLIGIIAMSTSLVLNLEAADLVNLDSFNLSMNGNATVNSQGAQAIVDWAKVIAEYMRDNNYYYDRINGPWDIRYNDGKSKASCCTTYVSWVLQAAGYLKDEEHTNLHSTLNTKLYSKKDEWKWMTVTSESELLAGDILIYDSDGVAHSNICAGEDPVTKEIVYWDAGDPKAASGAFIGQTKTHWMRGYTCSYRLIK